MLWAGPLVKAFLGASQVHVETSTAVTGPKWCEETRPLRTLEISWKTLIFQD
jgi:hypothetical protein